MNMFDKKKTFPDPTLQLSFNQSIVKREIYVAGYKSYFHRYKVIERMIKKPEKYFLSLLELQTLVIDMDN